MTDTPTARDPNDIISNTWFDTCMSLAVLEPPKSFTSKDVTRYGEAIDFLVKVGETLDPFFSALLAELESTSSITGISASTPTEWLSDYIIPEFAFVIDTLTEESEEPEAEPPSDEALEESDLEGVDEVDVEDDPNGDWDKAAEDDEVDVESNENKDPLP